MSKNLYIFFLIITSHLFSAKTIYTYDEKQGSKKYKIEWSLEEKKEEILELIGTDNLSITTMHLSPSFELIDFAYKENDNKTDYTLTLKDNSLLVKAKTKNGSIEKTHKLDSVWVQQFGFGLKPFITSDKKELKFCLVNPKDFSLYTMVASKEEIVPLTINEKKYEAQKVTVTVQGFKSLFWKAKLWFDQETKELLKYQANQGPNTETTIMTLESIKKEGFLENLQKSFLKNEKSIQTK